MDDLRQQAQDKLRLISRRRKWAHTRLLRLDSKVYRAFLEMEAAAFSDGALAKKQKELIALGISVATDCESCMQWHMEKAVEAGAVEQEIVEAIEVAIEMGGGRATVPARFALEVLDTLLPAR